MTCTDYSKIVRGVLLSIDSTLTAISNYPSAPESLDDVSYAITAAIGALDNHDPLKARAILSRQLNAIDLISKFDAGDAYARGIVAPVGKTFRATVQNGIDWIIKRCGNHCLSNPNRIIIPDAISSDSDDDSILYERLRDQDSCPSTSEECRLSLRWQPHIDEYTSCPYCTFRILHCKDAPKSTTCCSHPDCAKNYSDKKLHIILNCHRGIAPTDAIRRIKDFITSLAGSNSERYIRYDPGHIRRLRQ